MNWKNLTSLSLSAENLRQPHVVEVGVRLHDPKLLTAGDRILFVQSSLHAHTGAGLTLRVNLCAHRKDLYPQKKILYACMQMEEIIKYGIRKGLKICLDLGKIIIPLVFLFTLLKHLLLFERIADSVSPLMGLVGLPGSAAFPLMLVFFFDLYATIGAITPLNMTIKQLTVMAMMLLTAHSLILEGSILIKLKVKYARLIILRVVMTFIIGAFVNLVMA